MTDDLCVEHLYEACESRHPERANLPQIDGTGPHLLLHLPMPGTIVFVRHGESEGNALRRFSDSDDVPLTPAGREQARTTAGWLADHVAAARLVTSPYRRARQTAEIIGAAIGLLPEDEPALREQHLGELQGRPYEDAAKAPGFVEGARWAWRPPGGETLLEVQARAVVAVRRLARAHPSREVIAVAHSGTMTALWAAHASGWDAPERIPNCGILVLPHDGERFSAPELIILA